VQPARVELSHILVQVAVGATESQRNEALVKAQQIAREVQADKSRFGEIARAKSEDAGTANEGGKLGWITRGSWPASLESAVFALKKGDVSDPIDGPGGYHIFQANDVQPEHGETFDQAKSKVETEIRRQLGANRFAEMATKLTGLVYDNPGSLQPAADALGLKVKSASGITRDRLLSADQAGAGAASASADATILDDVRVRRALFSSKALADKQNSGVIEISPDTMVVVRVDSVTAAHVPALEKVTDRIRKQLVDERALAAAEQSGKQDLARLQQEPSDTVPEKFSDPVAISRVNPQGLNKPLLDAVFAASVKKLPAYIGVGTAQGYMVVRIDDAHEGKTDDPALAGLSAELDQAWGRAEERAVLEALRAQAEVKMLPEAAKAIAGETESQG
jgi:peptidyl-prolyl cis-trans isomerase D